MKRMIIRLIAVILTLSTVWSLASCSFFSKDDPDDKGSEDGGKEGGGETEEGAEPEYYDPRREDYYLGTCKELRGNVTVILFYVDDFESSWTEAERNKFTAEAIRPGLDFLKAEAEKRGISLNLTIRQSNSFYYDDEVITDSKSTGLVTSDVLYFGARSLGYTSSAKMLQAMKKQYRCSEIICFTIFNKAGKGGAINPKRGVDPANIDEHCTLFARDLIFSTQTPYKLQAPLVASYILFLYGAEKLYSPKSRELIASQSFSTDLMFELGYTLEGKEITNATAFYIGWTDGLPSEFNLYGWNDIS